MLGKIVLNNFYCLYSNVPELKPNILQQRAALPPLHLTAQPRHRQLQHTSQFLRQPAPVPPRQLSQPIRTHTATARPARSQTQPPRTHQVRSPTQPQQSANLPTEPAQRSGLAGTTTSYRSEAERTPRTERFFRTLRPRSTNSASVRPVSADCKLRPN
jgi:hypothetical protein